MAKVRFSEGREFLEELRQDHDLVVRRLVRITRLWRPVPDSPSLHSVYLVATCEVVENIVYLERYFGIVWGIKEQDQAVMDKLDAAQRDLEKRLADLGLEIRGGMIEEES